MQPLSLTSFDSSPSRGALGKTGNFSLTAKASPTRRGGNALALTERLYGAGPFHYSSLNAFNIRSPVSPLFSGWNWVPYTLPALTTPVTGME